MAHEYTDDLTELFRAASPEERAVLEGLMIRVSLGWRCPVCQTFFDVLYAPSRGHCLVCPQRETHP